MFIMFHLFRAKPYPQWRRPPNDAQWNLRLQHPHLKAVEQVLGEKRRFHPAKSLFETGKRALFHTYFDGFWPDAAGHGRSVCIEFSFTPSAV
jgi:hypothetical protein